MLYNSRYLFAQRTDGELHVHRLQKWPQAFQFRIAFRRTRAAKRIRVQSGAARKLRYAGKKFSVIRRKAGIDSA